MNIIKILSFLVSCLWCACSLLAQGSEQEHITGEMTQASGQDCKDGYIDLMINAGFSPYEVEWQRWENGAWSIQQQVSSTGVDGLEDLADLLPGRYRVVVRDALCGEASRVFMLGAGQSRIRLADRKHPLFCSNKNPRQNTCDGSLTVDIDSEESYSILWQGPDGFSATTATIENLCGGDYTLTVFIGDCKVERTYNLCCCELAEDTEAIVGDATKGEKDLEACESFYSQLNVQRRFLRSPTTADSYDGLIELEIYGGVLSQLALVWNGPDGFESTSQNIYNLGVGDYCVTIKDGCSEDKLCFTLVDCSKSEIEVGLVAILNSCEGYNAGSILLEGSGGVPPYRYLWSNGARSSSLSNISSGSYSVTVTDDAGCEASRIFQVGNNPLAYRDRDRPCGTDVICNNFVVGFIPYTGQIPCFYDDPDCRVQNCYCPLTGGVEATLPPVSYSAYRVNLNDCTLEGLCPDRNTWQVDINGSISEIDQLYQLNSCGDCYACYTRTICTIPGVGGADVEEPVFNGPPTVSPSSNCESGCAISCGNTEFVCVPCGSGLSDIDPDRILKAGTSYFAKSNLADHLLSQLLRNNGTTDSVVFLPSNTTLLTSFEEYKALFLQADVLTVEGQLSPFPSLETLERMANFYHSFDGVVESIREKGSTNNAIEACVELSPNPAAGFIRLEKLASCRSDATIVNVSLMTSNGVLLNTVQIQNVSLSDEALFIDVQEFPSGLYFCLVTFSDGQRQAKKFVKSQ